MPKIDRQKSTKKGAIPTTANPPKGLDEKRRRDRMLKKAKRYQDAARSREAAMGDKNISYVGDPFIVDGKKFDPAKEFPETYMRPEGAETFKLQRLKDHAIYGVDTMEKLQYIRGQIRSLEDLQQDLKDLLTTTEYDDEQVHGNTEED
jgi:hypothetical protein